jgi:hypothetical protein
VSVSEIIAELPKLTADEGSAIRRRLRELEDQDELQFLHEAADSMFQAMDNEEVENARCKTG